MSDTRWESEHMPPPIDASIACPRCANRNQTKIIGWEFRGDYDGILLWECLACHHRWPRFPPPDRRHDAALARIKELEDADAGPRIKVKRPSR